MNIALCHFRVGETDGVSLEMDKWKKALEQEGHNVLFIAGSAGRVAAEIILELHYQHPINNRIVENAYGGANDYQSIEKFEEEINRLAGKIEAGLLSIIEDHQIDILVPNNILSLGWGLPAGIAFTKAIEESGVRAICHHHDFHWERDRYANPNFDFIPDLLKTFFPPSHSRISHVCINSLAQSELKSRYGIEADVVPNVFDFEIQEFDIDDYNQNMRSDFGIGSNEIICLQATRVVERKAIELAIDFVAEFNQNNSKLFSEEPNTNNRWPSSSKAILVLAGKTESHAYYDRLMTYAKKSGVMILDISNRISHQRGSAKGKKIYSLWDAYTMADLITYPSVLEGWGNQLLEAVVAKKPVVVYEYPVYKSDIQNYEFKLISLGDTHQIRNGWVTIDQEKMKEAAEEVARYLSDGDSRQRLVDENYGIAQKSFSIARLRTMLKAMF